MDVRSGVAMRPERFIIIFAITVLAAFGLLLAPFVKPGVLQFSRALVNAAAFLIHLCGGHVKVDGAILRPASGGFAVEMRDGCNGVNVMILLWSAMLAFPAPWMHKAKGLLWGGLAIQSVNLVRFISLFYLGQYSLALFDFAHGYLWECLIMLDALVVFGLWVHLGFRTSGFPSLDTPHANR